MSVLEVNDLSKKYLFQNKEIMVLNHVNQTFDKGKIYNIVGHSGSGKTTLLRILGTLLDCDSGEVDIDGKNLSIMKEKEKARLRNQKIGFVFQDYLLNDKLKSYENVMIPMLINKDIIPKKRKERAIILLEKVRLTDRINHYPKEMSGGEQQRVAIARALANNPDIILADEPTGNLDKENEKIILDIFQELKKEGKCIVIASHSEYVKKYADVILHIEDGHLEVIRWESVMYSKFPF